MGSRSSPSQLTVSPKPPPPDRPGRHQNLAIARLLVRFAPGAHKLDGTRVFKTIPSRAYQLGRSESVSTAAGITVHYFYDPPLKSTSHNASVSGAMTTDVSTCAIVHKNEMYDLKRGRQWTLDAPIFGIAFGAKQMRLQSRKKASKARLLSSIGSRGSCS